MKLKFSFIIFQIFFLLFTAQLYSQWERLTEIRESQRYDHFQKDDNALLLNSTSLDSFITATMAIYHIPGLSVCIIKEDSLVWHQAYGYADVERKIPVTDSTIFDLASISKVITGTAIMQLYERGLLNLDDDVNKYLPADLQVVNPYHPNIPITCRMILSHVASIDWDWNVMGQYVVAGDSPIPLFDFLKNYFVPGGAYYTSANYNSYPPGSAFNGSDHAGKALLGYLVEAITDTSFEEYCQKHIFVPLGMNETSWRLANLDTSHIARPYTWTSSEYIPHPHRGIPWYPNGLLRTSSLQLARYLNAFMQKGTLEGIKILERSTRELITKSNYPKIILPWQGSQGLLWYQLYIGNRLVWGHHGSFSPGVTTAMFYFEPEKSGVIVLMNQYAEESIDRMLIALFDYAADIYFDAKIKVSDSLDFVADYGEQDTVTFVIRNIGFKALNINDIKISGTHFQIADPLIYPIHLDYNESLKINLIFTFTAQSHVTDTLKLFSSDPDTPIKSVILHGNTLFPAQEGVIYAVTGRLSSGAFLTIDPDSGNGHIVGHSGFSEITGVAIQPSTGIIYGTIGGIATTQLIKIDAPSGRAFEKLTIPVPRLRAIAFDTNDDLYLANLYTSQLYRLNPIAGDTTYIGTPKIKNLSGLTINPVDGQLWGTGASDDEIYQINKKTGAATLIGKTGFANTSDIAFDAAGKLFGLSGFSRLTPPTDFIKIDPATGIGTLIGSTGFKAVYGLAIRGKVNTTDIQMLTEEQIPTQFDLKQNYPNPFNPATIIEFALPKSAFVTLKVYNLLSEEVAMLISEQLSAGIHKLSWDARGLASGIYLYQLKTDEFVQMKKLILMR